MIKPLISNKELNDFLRDNREKSLRFLQGRYSALPIDDLEDVYQESSIALYQKIQNGELAELSSSLYSYFLGMCRNQIEKWLRDNHIQQTLHKEETDFNDTDENVNEDRLADLEMWAGTYEMDEDFSSVEYQEFLVKVKESVRNMPAPCNQVLWSYYWEGFSHKQIAELYGMKSEDVCKTQASRCKKKFCELIKRIRPNYGK